MEFNKREAFTYIWNGDDESVAFTRTTHLAIAAHPDDVEFMAYHGILECFRKHDKHFSAIVAADGDGSPRTGLYKDCTNSDMIKIRSDEQKKAASIGEYSMLAQLMYTSKQVKDPNDTALVDDLVKILLATTPQVVYTHNLADKHDTHVAVAMRTITAIRKLPHEIRPKKVYGCEVWRGLDWMEDNERIQLDVSDRQNLAYALTNVFDSQITGGKNYGAGAVGRHRANATFASATTVDTATHVTYAMDLTPLAHNDDLDVGEFVLGYIKSFHDTVQNKIKTLG